MLEPLISVIIPVYKTEKYILRCVKSVSGQTYKNLEIILVDDGSPDKCPKLCEKLAKKDQRITVIHQENAGEGAARNTGLNACRGEYVSFVDSDDYVHSMFIESLYRTLVKYNADIVACDMIKTSSDRLAVSKYSSGGKAKDISLSGLEAALRIIDDKDYSRNVSVCNKLFKISIFDNIRFSNRKIAADLDVAYRALFISNKVVLSDNAMYYYYMNKNSAIHTHDDVSIYVKDVLDEYDQMCTEYIEDANILRHQQELTHMKRMDFVLEDYFFAFMNQHRQRMISAKKDYMKLKVKADEMNMPLKLKLRLFDISPGLYLVSRWGYGVLDSFKETVRTIFELRGGSRG